MKIKELKTSHRLLGMNSIFFLYVYLEANADTCSRNSLISEQIKGCTSACCSDLKRSVVLKSYKLLTDRISTNPPLACAGLKT